MDAVNVTLLAPVKINGRRVEAGTPVSVPRELATELEAAGAIAGFDVAGAPLATDFDAAVAERADAMIEAAVSAALVAPTAEIARLKAELDALSGSSADAAPPTCGREKTAAQNRAD